MRHGSNIYKEIQVYTATYQLLFPKLLTHLKTLKCLSSQEYINPQNPSYYPKAQGRF